MGIQSRLLKYKIKPKPNHITYCFKLIDNKYKKRSSKVIQNIVLCKVYTVLSFIHNNEKKF